MNQRTQRTPPTAKKFAEAFIRKANSLENKLREMCKTASACKVSNDVIVSNLMKTVCNEMFVRENVHALHERYKSLHSGIMDSLKEAFFEFFGSFCRFSYGNNGLSQGGSCRLD